MSSSTSQKVDDSEAMAEAPDATAIYRIWPGNGVPPGSEDWDWQPKTMLAPWSETPRRMVRNIVVPTITRFDPKPGTANGTAIIIAPGGAFHFLMIDHEGYDMARWLNGLGVTAFVLKYRVARTPDDDDELLIFRNELQKRLGQVRQDESEPPSGAIRHQARLWSEQDGRQAIKFVRQHASEWGINAKRIGIAGFSAGGGPAMGALLENDRDSRPDFAAGIYPSYRGGVAVPKDAAPLFLAIADDDKSVAPLSAARLYEAWHKAGVSAELHIFGNGAHGFGMEKSAFLSDIWVELFRNWLKAQGFLPPAP